MARPALILVATLFASLTLHAAEPGNARKAVLVTGASTGIGRLTTEHLAASGFFVYAGARKQADLDALNALDHVQAVRLDVTVQSEIDAAVELVRREGRGLWGLVNNAGVLVLGPLVEMPDEDFEWVFDVNVDGVFRVTKAFAPLIVESKGRIVNISSISGFGASPYAGAYAMTKHAVEAFTDSLAELMVEVDVRVSGIQPGNYRTNIGLTTCRHVVSRKEAYRGLFFDYMQEMVEDCEKLTAAGVDDEGVEPFAVARAIGHALSAEQPKPRYLVGSDPLDAEWAIRAAIWELASLNYDHEHSVSREQLIAWLDEELERLEAGAAHKAPIE